MSVPAGKLKHHLHNLDHAAKLVDETTEALVLHKDTPEGAGAIALLLATKNLLNDAYARVFGLSLVPKEKA